MLRVEDVRGRRVVDDDGVLEITANLREVLLNALVSGCGRRQWSQSYFDVVTLVVVTTFAEKSVVDNAVDVKLVKERVAVLYLLACII
jgi:hypothetical protein